MYSLIIEYKKMNKKESKQWNFRFWTLGQNETSESTLKDSCF
jgi:hypothetical protein